MSDLGVHMEAVARELLGDPNPRHSTKRELRYGTNGALSVDLGKGTFYDNEAGEGGGVLKLIEQHKGLKGREAVEWMSEIGCRVEPDDAPAPAARNGAANGQGKAQTAAKPPPAAKPAARDGPGKIVKTYDYTDDTGRLLFQVCRMEPKTFRQRRPDPAGRDGWSWSVPESLRCVPYRLPEVLEAVRAGETVFVVEGEKDVDRLWDEGAAATCNIGGAGKSVDALVQWLVGASVCVLPDNDPQKKKPDGSLIFHDDGKPVLAGQDHAKAIATALAPVARRVAVLELPGLPDKGDVSDWLDAGNSIDALYERAGEKAIDADDYDPAASYIAAHPELNVFRSRLGLVLWRDMGRVTAPYEYVIKNWLVGGEVSVCAGPSQSGKSFLILDMAMAIARGLPFLGRYRVTQGAVLYQAGEGGQGFKARRIPAYRKAKGLDWTADLPLAVTLRQINLHGNDEHAEAIIADAKALEAETGQPVRLIVVDTVSAATPGADEVSARDVVPVLVRCTRIAQQTGAHVMLVAHMNADATKIRGNTAYKANVDTVIIVKELPDQHDADNRQIREFVLDKQKDGETGRRERFVLPAVTIGTDFDGDPITSCVIAEPNAGAMEGIDTATPVDREALSTQAVLYLRAVRDAAAEHGVAPPPEVKLPREMMVVHKDHVRDVFAQRQTELDGPGLRQARKRQGDLLQKKGLIGVHDPWLWVTGKKVAGSKPGDDVTLQPANITDLSPVDPIW